MAETVISTPAESTSVESTASSFSREWREICSGVRRWSGKGSLALLDQGLISGANFLVGILLARHLAANQYGAYALAFEVFIFLMVAYGALVLEPLSVFGPSIYKDSNREYLGALIRIHGAIAAVIFVVLGTCAWVLHAISPGGNMAPALLGVALASPCVLLFWLARRGFYIKLSPRQAAAGALVYSVIVFGGLLVAYYHGLLSPFVAFVLMGAGAAVTAPIMLVRLGVSLNPLRGISKTAEVVRRHWGYGRWALGSAAAIWFSGAIYYPLLGSFYGLSSAGALKALMNFSSPIAQAFAAMSLLSLPYAAQVHHRGKSCKSNNLAVKLVLIYAGGTILYWLIIVLFRKPLVFHLYAGKYQEITGLLPWLALGSVLRISATSQAVILRAAHSPSLVFVAYVASSVTAILVGVPCTSVFGLQGVVFTLVISSAVALTVTSILVYRSSIHTGKAESKHTTQEFILGCK